MMERKRQTVQGILRKYIKTGGGVLHLRDGRVIEANQVFLAREDEISPAFQDVVKLVDGQKAHDPTYHVSFILGARPDGLYNVVNRATGKPLNSAGLSKDRAEALTQELMAR